MLTVYVIGSFFILAVVAASLFFLFGKEKDEVMIYWGSAWLLYATGLMLALCASHFDTMSLIEIKKVSDMYSLLFLLFGVYRLQRVKYPGYYMRFSIYLTVWIVISMFLELDILSTSLPLFLFDLVLTGTMGYVIIRYWSYGVYAKVGCFLVFVFWGIMKSILTVGEVKLFSTAPAYMGEIIYANIFIVCIFAIYIKHIKMEAARTEERFKIIVENAIDAIFYYTFRPSPAFLYITPSIEEITGYAPQAFYSNPRAILEITDKNSFNVINRMFFSGADAAMPTNEILKILRKDGAVIWVEINVSVIRDGDRIIAVEGIMRDITQMKQMQDDLITSKQSRDLMLSYISHELKTPVTSILGYATAIKDGVIENDEERGKAMEIISQKSLMLERMIQDLFQLSQLESNQYSFTYKHMDSMELAKELYKHVMPELKESGIKYEFIIDDQALKDTAVIVDPDRMNQVLTNLVINAIKYTKEKNRITIKYTSDKKHKNIIISVTDRGTGISEEDLPHVFERFFKTSNPNKKKTMGSGLGLALSKEIVTAHGGSIKAESRYGKGSTFTVSIPVYHEG